MHGEYAIRRVIRCLGNAGRVRESNAMRDSAQYLYYDTRKLITVTNSFV